MKNKILFVLAFLWLPLAAAAGDIKPGAVPGSINYQGRLERDNAPVTGIIHLFFRIYNAASSGTLRWQSAEIVVNAAQGIFSANITPPWDVFSRSETLYLEVQVESDVLAPREPLNSVAYALVAKKLEDGASISVNTLTAAYQVLLATAPGAIVLIGTGTYSPGYQLTVNGNIMATEICFPNNTCMYDGTSGTAVGGVTAPINNVIQSGTSGTGYMSFKTANYERMRINDSSGDGRIAIGTAAIAGPMGTLDVDGSLYVGSAGIYDRDDLELNVKQNLVVEGGHLRGVGLNYLSLGETPNTLIAATNNVQRVWIDPAGNVGVGLPAPTEPIHAAGNIRSNTGVRGGAASIGGYTGWLSADNEVRAQNGSHLLLQYNNPFNVGIGTDTPREKLHVHGSVLADYGVIASTADFSGNVGVGGNFTANGLNRQVFLTSTTIYGTLTVSGGIGSMAGFPAYIASTQTLTGLNTFANQVVVSSDIMTPSRLGVAMKDFNFGSGRYLQVGDNKPEYSAQDTLAYLVGGDSANARLSFYRGAALAGSLGTQDGPNLALVVEGQTKTLTDAVYHRIQNSVVWISTGMNTTPAVYVSSRDGNVGIGTTIADPNYKMTLNGVLHIVGTGNGIVFPNGSFISSNTVGTAVSVSNFGDALVMANTGGDGGNVILRNHNLDGLVVDSSGRVGIGTLYPASQLNVRGGDLVVGNPVIPASSVPENLIVAGNIVFDGALIQRSLSATQLSGLLVAGDVSLSTATGARTGIGTITPGFPLDVNGDINASGNVRTGGTARISASGTVGSGGANATWDGAIIGLNRGGSGANLSATGGANQFVRQSGTGSAFTVSAILDADVPDNITIAGTNNVTWGSVNKSGSSLADLGTKSASDLNSGTLAVSYGGTGATTLSGVVKGNTTAPFTAMTGTANTLTKWTATDTIGNSVITDDGTTVNVNNHKITNVTDPGSLQDAATKNYVDLQLTGGLGTTWSRTGNAILVTDWLGSSNLQAVVIKTANTTAMTITTGQVVQLANALEVSNAVTAATFNGSLNGDVTGNVSGSAGTAGTVTTAAQPNITSVGTLTGLTVTAPITGSVTGSAGTAGTVTTAAQPNITSVGTLTSLSMGGGLTLFSKTKALLNAITPAIGDVYFCTDCVPAKVVVATGTSSGNFADAVGGTFQ